MSTFGCAQLNKDSVNFRERVNSFMRGVSDIVFVYAQWFVELDDNACILSSIINNGRKPIATCCSERLWTFTEASKIYKRLRTVDTCNWISNIGNIPLKLSMFNSDYEAFLA